MAHVAKYTKSAVGHMLDHYGRTADDGVNRSNGEIDNGRTAENYNLAPEHEGGQMAFLQKRLSEVRVQNRKDVNVLCDWVVTLPKDAASHGRGFFKAAYEFLENRYGQKNVVSAYVHMDETTPHMHFAFVPVTEDKKRGGFKVSAKEVLTRHELQAFHGDFQGCMDDRGIICSVLNEATKEGNRSIAELKRQSAAEKLRETNEKAAGILSEAQRGVKILQQQEKTLKGQIEGLQRDIKTAGQVKDVPHAKSLMGGKVTVSPEDFEKLCRTAAMAEALQKEVGQARNTNTHAKTIIRDAELKAAEIVKQAEHKAGSITEKMESAKYRKMLEHVQNVINSDSDLVKSYKDAERSIADQEHRQQNMMGRMR